MKDAEDQAVTEAQMQTTVQAPKRVLELDGLRAFAILLVLLHHSYAPGVPLLTAVGEMGWMGVDLFFVLSGYLITGILVDTAGKEHYYRNFIARRTLRIFPLYYACLLLFIATGKWMQGASGWARMQAWGVGWFFVYLGNFRQAWLGQEPIGQSFVPLWSLQVEEQFYLLFPLAVWLLSRRNLMRLLTVCAVVAPLTRIYFWYRNPADLASIYVLTTSRMDALSMGGMVALLTRSRPAWLRRGGLILVGAVAGAGALAIAHLYGYVFYDNAGMRTIGFTLVDFCCASILCWVVLSPASRVSAALRWKPLVYTGTIAYGLYLLNMPASVAGRKIAGQLMGSHIPAHCFLAMGILFPATYLLAGLSWHFFEKPVLRLKDRFSVSASGR